MTTCQASKAEGRRFTLDGSPALEAHLARLCDLVREGVRAIVPSSKLDALVLGGGYGRGQGGVLETAARDRPYNDLEFYVFLAGNRLLNEYRYGGALHQLGESLSDKAGLHVEFKIDSLNQFRRRPISMFSYDLVAGHRIIQGGADVFESCSHHLPPESIPPSEATRLLFNRATGLLLAKELLNKIQELPSDDIDFIGRNIAKARLALGDAVLAAFGQYHWSCLERHLRLMAFAPTEPLPWLPEVKTQHATGVQFKLHPCRTVEPAEKLSREHDRLSALALDLWLWLESRRLNRRFATPLEYARSGPKCFETSPWRNYLLNLKTFGLGAALDPMARRYPRERLLNALALLLWNGEAALEPRVLRYLQKQLRTTAADWAGMVAAYKRIWPAYG